MNGLQNAHDFPQPLTMKKPSDIFNRAYETESYEPK